MGAPGIDSRVGELAAAHFVVAMVAAAFATRGEVLTAPSRGTSGAALARHVAMYLAHTRLHLSLTSAACLFDRDRTTVGHACRIVEMRRENPTIDRIVDLLERAVDIHRRGGIRS